MIDMPSKIMIVVMGVSDGSTRSRALSLSKGKINTRLAGVFVP